jgi:putative ATP-binding cassette transporter
MNLFKYLARQSWRLLLLAIFTSILGGICSTAIVGIIAKAIAGTASPTVLMWSFFGACTTLIVCMAVSQITLVHITQAGIYKLRVALSHKLLAAPLEKQMELGNNGVLLILTRDINVFVDVLPMVPSLLANCVVLLSCIAYVGWLSWQLLIVLAVLTLGGMAIFHRAQQRPLSQLAKVREHIEDLYLHFRNLIEGGKELRLNAERGKLFVDTLIAPKAMEFRKALSACVTQFAWIGEIGSVTFYLIIGIMLFAIPHWLPQARESLATVTLVVLYLVRPITELMNASPAIKQASIALASIEKLDGALDLEAPVAHPEKVFARAQGFSLELCDIRHRYASDAEDTQFTLGPLNVEVGPGEIVYIVGGNGSGKTTLAMLMLGLYRAEGGTIRLNGVEVTEENRAEYRTYFSAVFAEFHLFEQILGTDREQLASRAAQYVDMLGMAHKVRIENGRFSTLALSSGQRKRLALVSSYLEDRQVYVFDEWAADQDPRFKRIFYRELLPELKARGKTVLVITHDDAYFDHADRIIKLDEGRVQSAAGAGADGPRAALHVA